MIRSLSGVAAAALVAVMGVLPFIWDNIPEMLTMPGLVIGLIILAWALWPVLAGGRGKR